MVEPNQQQRMSGYSQPRQRDISIRRSPIIGFLKIALPSVMVILALALLLWPTIQNQMVVDISKPVEISEPERIRAQTQNTLLDAKFSSVTEAGLPFNIESEEATQNLSDPNQVTMIKPVAVLNLNDGSKVTLSSETGEVNQESGQLTLDGSVVLSRDDGTMLKTQNIIANLKQGTAEGNDLVELTGPDGRIDAKGLLLREQGNLLIFKGPARLEMTTEDTPMTFGGA